MKIQDGGGAILNLEKCQYLRGRLWATTVQVHAVDSLRDDYNFKFLFSTAMLTVAF